MKKVVFILLFAVLFGCASGPQTLKPLDGASLAPLATAKIAVTYQLVDKRINYSEVLYRVLWLENKAATQDFSGLWQADRDLTAYAVARLRQQGFQVDSAYSLADAAIVDANLRYNALVTRRNSNINAPGLPGVKLLPAAVFFEESQKSPEFRTLAEQLLSKGYSYLAEFTAMDIAASAPGYGLVVVTAMPNLRIVDLNSGRVLWAYNLRHGEPFQLGGDLKKLEENDMSKAKEGLKAGIAKFDFVSLLGITPAPASKL